MRARAGERPAIPPGTDLASSTARSIFDKFDINGDGLMSLGEFLLVLTLLSIPENDIAIIFRCAREHCIAAVWEVTVP